MNNSLKYFVLSLLLVTIAGCTEDDITQKVGPLPDETLINILGGQLRSERTLSNIIAINLYEDDKEGIEKISYTLTKPTTNNVTLKIIADVTLIDTYNQENNTQLDALPITNINFENEGTLTITAGKQISTPIEVYISTKGLETGKPYLLALTVTNTFKTTDVLTEKQRLYYIVNIQEKVTDCEPNFGELQDIPPLLPNLISVFYVNTETYQPLVVGAWGTKAGNTLYSLGNIVNLKTATIDYNTDNQRTLLKLGSDLSYVLEHSNKYIRPLQEYERKVCICIENGGKGVGFCNMNDTQIADFVRQIKEVIIRYNLDGVNLWDDDSKYGKIGMPEITTTSYPKFIKVLREALPEKLITLVDKGNATEYFYDVAKCGGIEVGHYIDYAWHGYFSPIEEVQIINPNLEGGTQNYSKYKRKPISGLNESCYGSVNIPRYPNNNSSIRQLAGQAIAKWKTIGNKKSNIIVYGDNLIGNEYGDRENAVKQMLSEYSLSIFMDDGRGWDFENNRFLREKVRYSAGILNYTVDVPALNIYTKDW